MLVIAKEELVSEPNHLEREARDLRSGSDQVEYATIGAPTRASVFPTQSHEDATKLRRCCSGVSEVA
jgi:hypothetical protein